MRVSQITASRCLFNNSEHQDARVLRKIKELHFCDRKGTIPAVG
jgi:hypothetical protein